MKQDESKDSGGEEPKTVHLESVKGEERGRGAAREKSPFEDAMIWTPVNPPPGAISEMSPKKKRAPTPHAPRTVIPRSPPMPMPLSDKPDKKNLDKDDDDDLEWSKVSSEGSLYFKNGRWYGVHGDPVSPDTEDHLNNTIEWQWNELIEEDKLRKTKKEMMASFAEQLIKDRTALQKKEQEWERVPNGGLNGGLAEFQQAVEHMLDSRIEDGKALLKSKINTAEAEIKRLKSQQSAIKAGPVSKSFSCSSSEEELKDDEWVTTSGEPLSPNTRSLIKMHIDFEWAELPPEGRMVTTKDKMTRQYIKQVYGQKKEGGNQGEQHTNFVNLSAEDFDASRQDVIYASGGPKTSGQKAEASSYANSSLDLNDSEESRASSTRVGSPECGTPHIRTLRDGTIIKGVAGISFAGFIPPNQKKAGSMGKDKAQNPAPSNRAGQNELGDGEMPLTPPETLPDENKCEKDVDTTMSDYKKTEECEESTPVDVETCSAIQERDKRNEMSKRTADDEDTVMMDAPPTLTLDTIIVSSGMKRLSSETLDDVSSPTKKYKEDGDGSDRTGSLSLS
ncbi:hypothetical protein F5Y16DRAFT_398301 [Xylariaceae sp. FL0255]|nr:hypothetical protein F5Y16DRAFT_398301 [Xylariaceae sp. FL0255]